MRSLAIALVFGTWAFWGTSLASAADPDLHGDWSQAVPPFRVVGNIYYVGAKNIASYLIVTPEGNILLDTGTREMVPVVKAGIEKLGFKVADVKILLSGHAHYDHVEGHAAMKKASGATVMAMAQDVGALQAGQDQSPLADKEKWDGVKVDKVLKDGDTVSLGGTTMRASLVPGHTPGCTVWSTDTKDKDKSYAVAFMACLGPNASVKLVGNPKFPHLVADTRSGFKKLESLHPDIVLMMHPGEDFAGKMDKMGATPHPLYDPEGWKKLVAEIESDFEARVAKETKK